MTAEAVPHTAPEQQPKPPKKQPKQPNGSQWPVPPMDGYTVDDYFRLDLPPHTELIDGSLVFVSPQRFFHMTTMLLLDLALRRSIPEHLSVAREMAVVISKRNVPEPDLIVFKTEAFKGERQTRLDAKDVLLAIEVVSPDSEDRDRDTKPHKYAGAGIPHFWRVEMADEHDRPVIHVYELDSAARNPVYVPTGIFRDRLKVDVPFPITVDLAEFDNLRPGGRFGDR
jgi:Uma2 family endonuclease